MACWKPAEATIFLNWTAISEKRFAEVQTSSSKLVGSWMGIVVNSDFVFLSQRTAAQLCVQLVCRLRAFARLEGKVWSGSRAANPGANRRGYNGVTFFWSASSRFHLPALVSTGCASATHNTRWWRLPTRGTSCSLRPHGNRILPLVRFHEAEDLGGTEPVSLAVSFPSAIQAVAFARHRSCQRRLTVLEANTINKV